MYLNGAGTGTEITRKEMRPTLRVPCLARSASYVAVAGTTTPLTVVRLTATTSRRRAAAWAFALFALVLKKGYTLRRTANLFQE